MQFDWYSSHSAAYLMTCCLIISCVGLLHGAVSMESIGLLTGYIYAVGTSVDSTVVVSVIEPHQHRIVNAWKIHNVTVTACAFWPMYTVSQKRSHFYFLITRSNVTRI